MKPRWYQSTLALALALCTATAGLAQDKSKFKPLEEKNDPTLIGKRDINKGNLSFYSVDREVALGRQMSAQVDRESRLINDPIVSEYINRVAQNIVLHSDSKIPFTIKVIDSNDVNAFALPGGYLYVNRGLLEAAENEAEVAGVMAHEIAHVAARHGIEQASKGELVNWASIPLIFLGGLPGYVLQQSYGLLVPLTFLKFSRGAEKEADRLGAQYMWAAGYDPNALITFFEKLQAQEKRRPGTLAKVFSTHPLTGDRIKEVRELIVRFPEKNEYQISTSEFGNVKSRLLAASAASRPVNNGDDRRPTLKRRPQSDSDASADSPNAPNSSDRPVLRRRDNSGDGANGTSTGSSTESADDGRPVLKRRDSSTTEKTSESSGEKTSSEKTTNGEKPATEDGERPVLKRCDASTTSETESKTKPAETTPESSERPVLKRRSDSEKPPNNF